MNTKAIRSRDNALFQQLRRLEQSSRERRRSGLALIEGPHLLEAFAAASQSPAGIVAAGESALQRPAIARLFESAAAESKIVLADSLIAAVSQVVTGQGLVAAIPLPTAPTAAAPGSDALLLDRIQDPGNLGSILRTSLAAGVKDVFLSPGTVDAWNPKVLRSAMGAHFGLRLHQDVDLGESIRVIGTRCYATSGTAQRSLYDLHLKAPSAWIFGNEGSGVSAEALQSEAVAIPMPGGTESLNVAAAVAVCLFEQLRQRSATRLKTQ